MGMRGGSVMVRWFGVIRRMWGSEGGCLRGVRS
jgi:hypothetical protein